VPSKVCFVTFKERSAVETALHLTNTLFIDRTLIVAQSRYEVIPEENVAMSLATPAVAASYVDKKSLLGSGINSAPLLPTPQKSLLGTPQMLPNPLASAVQQAQAIASSINANIQSTDDIIASHGASVKGDSSKNDEIRRTIYIGNLSTSLHPDEILNYFQTCGEIRYLRMAGDETQPTRFAFIEFANPESVQIALQYNGAMFGNIPIRVISSKSAIIKPHGKSFENSHKEVDDTSKRDKQSSKDERRRRSKTRSK
jgi:arginine/serine-rich splicing factor 12